MAKSNPTSDKNWIDVAVPDPANPPRLLVLTGYAGRSDRAGHLRLYADASLASWLDVPEAKVAHRHFSSDTLGLAVTSVWVLADAVLVSAHTASPAAGFLSGPITAPGAVAPFRVTRPIFGESALCPPSAVPTECCPPTTTCPRTTTCPSADASCPAPTQTGFTAFQAARPPIIGPTVVCPPTTVATECCPPPSPKPGGGFTG